MIVSASRRTDIPAFYPDWFYRRLEEGYLYVRNPMNPRQVSDLRLNRDTVDCFVFWTKNPGPMMDRFSLLDDKGYPYYFQFTLTAYGRDLEPGLPDKNELVRIFRELSRRIGPDRVVWRYDPVLLGGIYDLEFHRQWFERLCGSLSGYTGTCVISFLDMYARIRKNMEQRGIRPMETGDICRVAEAFGAIAPRYGIEIQTCCEDIDLGAYGIVKGKCIDGQRISQITGRCLNVKKDDTQRESCGCVKSVDIGAYHTCAHFCRYCYANNSPDQVMANRGQHDPASPLLSGRLNGDERITRREMKSVYADKKNQDGQLELHWE